MPSLDRFSYQKVVQSGAPHLDVSPSLTRMTRQFFRS